MSTDPLPSPLHLLLFAGGLRLVAELLLRTRQLLCTPRPVRPTPAHLCQPRRAPTSFRPARRYGVPHTNPNGPQRTSPTRPVSWPPPRAPRPPAAGRSLARRFWIGATSSTAEACARGERERGCQSGWRGGGECEEEEIGAELLGVQAAVSALTLLWRGRS